MPEQTRNEKPRGLTRDGLRGLGLLLCALGALGSAVFQNGLLGLSRYTGAELLAAMQASDTVMGYATAAILLQAAGACALPIFTFLLVEGFSHTADLKRYALRLGAAAALSFADCWNLVEQPLVYLTDTNLQPLSVMFNQMNEQSTAVAFAGAALYLLPMLLVYLYFQDDILLGVQLSELK